MSNEDQWLKVGDVAKVAGVSVRTLHHYDQIGLLRPRGRSVAGYRLYDRDDLLRLQQIQIGRSLGLCLAEIRAQIDDPDFDHRQALVDQRERLEARLDDTRRMLAAVDAALTELAETTPTRSVQGIDWASIFDGFDPEEHAAEAEARWGDSDAYRESARRTANYDESQWRAIKAEADAVLADFARCMRAGTPATHAAAVDLAERHRIHIDTWFYPCSAGKHASLADLYVSDARFEANFEKVAPGLAAYVAEAIRANARC